MQKHAKMLRISQIEIALREWWKHLYLNMAEIWFQVECNIFLAVTYTFGFCQRENMMLIFDIGQGALRTFFKRRNGDRESGWKTNLHNV